MVYCCDAVKTCTMEQIWRKTYAGGKNIYFNPVLSTIENAVNSRIILFVHTGKCAGQSIQEGMARILRSHAVIFEYHVFDANKRLLEALEYLEGKKTAQFSIVIATREPLRRWASSFNWDLHNLFLSHNRKHPRDFEKYSNVNQLVSGIMRKESQAVKFGKFGHMGMGISWYLPTDKHFLLKPENTYVLRTESLDADFRSFIGHFFGKHSLFMNGLATEDLNLSRTKHDFHLSYPVGTFQDLDYSNQVALDAMKSYLDDDITSHSRLVSSFVRQRA
jgi:hypothetical protein